MIMDILSILGVAVIVIIVALIAFKAYLAGMRSRDDPAKSSATSIAGDDEPLRRS